MSPEKWEEIKDMAKRNFEVLESSREETDEGITDLIVFNGPMGRIKLEYVSKPLVLEKKAHYSKRMGATATVDYVVSETEKVNTLYAYKWNAPSDEWEKISASSFDQQ